MNRIVIPLQISRNFTYLVKKRGGEPGIPKHWHSPIPRDVIVVAPSDECSREYLKIFVDTPWKERRSFLIYPPTRLYKRIYIEAQIFESSATKYSCRVIAEEEGEEAVAERPKGSKQFQRKDYVSADRGE